MEVFIEPVIASRVGHNMRCRIDYILTQLLHTLQLTPAFGLPRRLGMQRFQSGSRGSNLERENSRRLRPFRRQSAFNT